LGLDLGGPPADLAAPEVSRLSSDTIRTALVVDHSADFERTAGSFGGPAAPEEAIAIVFHDHLPLGTNDALVDLELDLQAAVLRAELQFPITAAAAVSRALNIVSFAIAGAATGIAKAVASTVEASNLRALIPCSPHRLLPTRFQLHRSS